MYLNFPRRLVSGRDVQSNFQYLYEFALLYSCQIVRSRMIKGKILYAPDPDDLAHDVLLRVLESEGRTIRNVKNVKGHIQTETRRRLIKYDRDLRREKEAEVPGPSFPDPDALDRRIDVQRALARFEGTFAEQRPSASGKDYPARQLAALHHLCLYQRAENLRGLADQLGLRSTECARQILDRAMRRLRHPSYTRQVSVWIGRLTHEERVEFDNWKRQMNGQHRWWGLRIPYPEVEPRETFDTYLW